MDPDNVTGPVWMNHATKTAQTTEPANGMLIVPPGEKPSRVAAALIRGSNLREANP